MQEHLNLEKHKRRRARRRILKVLGLQSFGQFYGIGSFVLILSFALALFISSKTTPLHADTPKVVSIEAPKLPVAVAALRGNEQPKYDTAIKLVAVHHPLADDIATTYERNMPVAGVSISKNSEVVLSDRQAEFVKAFGEYLSDRGEKAIVTSGTRTQASQLGIIKEKIVQLKALRKFPSLLAATVSDSRIWLKAWNWLRAKHVPVNAPAEVAGAEGHSSMHIQGRAIDFIASSLDKLHGWLADFARSKYAAKSQMKIAAIVREPGCVHINLVG